MQLAKRTFEIVNKNDRLKVLSDREKATILSLKTEFKRKEFISSLNKMKMGKKIGEKAKNKVNKTIS